MTIIFGALGSIIGWLVCQSIDAWGPGFARWVTISSASTLPSDYRIRYTEEWLAHLDSMPNATSKVFSAVAFSLASCRMNGSIRWNRLGEVDQYEVTERGIDVAFAAFAIFLLTPLFLIVAIFIKVESRGPILQRHPRIGKDGKEFFCLSFRYFYIDADERFKRLLEQDPASAEEWFSTQKLRADPRFTRTGRFLREASLSNLPQLFNVLNGTMSIVGPRAMVEAEIAHYEKYYELYKTVRPGIAGIESWSDLSSSSYEERLSSEMEFIRTRKIKTRLWFIIKTIAGTIRGRR